MLLLAGTCLLSCCLQIDISSSSNIPDCYWGQTNKDHERLKNRLKWSLHESYFRGTVRSCVQSCLLLCTCSFLTCVSFIVATLLTHGVWKSRRMQTGPKFLSQQWEFCLFISLSIARGVLSVWWRQYWSWNYCLGLWRVEGGRGDRGEWGLWE